MRKFIGKFIFASMSLNFSVTPYAADESKLPPFTPNVVDPTGVLTNGEIQELNDEFVTLHKKNNIRPAVFITQELDGSSVGDGRRKAPALLSTPQF